MKLRILILLIAGSFTLFADPPRGDSWSDTVNGIRARLVVVPAGDSRGTELAMVYIEIQNVSDILNSRKVWIDTTSSQFQWQLRDGSGRSVKVGPYVCSIMTPPPYWITLPYDSMLRFRVSVRGYGIARGGVAIQLPNGFFWQITPQKGEVYSLSADFTSSAPDSPDAKEEWHGQVWKGTLRLPMVPIPYNNEPNKSVPSDVPAK